MLSINQKCEEFAYPNFPWQEDQRGFYFPDFIILPFMTEAKHITKELFEKHRTIDSTVLPPLNRHMIKIPKPHISWPESCALVVAAFEKFCPKLGTKAQNVINHTARWTLNKVKTGDAGGYCHPARCETNPNPYAVIEYNFDETINDTVYIAHELGHLIADDSLQESGFSYQDAKQHMAEIQAFFTQYILYDFLKSHPDHRLRQAGRSHFIGEITRNLYNIPVGLGALEAEKLDISGADDYKIRNAYSSLVQEWLGKDFASYKKAARLSKHIINPYKRDHLGICDLHQHAMASILTGGLFLHTDTRPPSERAAFIHTLFGKEGPKNICEIFETAGIHTHEDLQTLAKNTIKHISEPLRTFTANTYAQVPQHDHNIFQCS